MNKFYIFFIAIVGLVGCATSESQIQQALIKNPDLVFDVIKNNPEKFIEVVNQAAQRAQQRQYEKQISEMKVQQELEIKNPKQPVLLQDRRLQGNSDGKIVIVEYADFQCPACKMAHASLKEFKKRNKGKFQFYFKHLPLSFHKEALPAARYFEAIRLQSAEKALRFHDLVFENQDQLGQKSFLEKMAQKIGADMGSLKKDLDSKKVQEVIDADQAEFEKFGFTGTPVILINGVALHGAQRTEELERISKMTAKN